MQTLHLRLQDLRAISLGQSPGRWPSPSMLIASTWKGARPLPNHPYPTSAVGLRPEHQLQNLDRCPTVGTGLFLSLPFRGASICGATAPDLGLVCPGQTSDVCRKSPAPHTAGEIGGPHRKALASESRWLASSGLSFFRRHAPHMAGAGGKKTWACGPGSARSARALTSVRLPRTSIGPLSAHLGDGSGTMCSEAPGLRPTGRLKPAPLRKIRGQTSTSFCADTPALVTGQEPGGTGVPGDALLRPALALRWLLSSAREEGAWPATTSP